jgi:hypothetical protein
LPRKVWRDDGAGRETPEDLEVENNQLKKLLAEVLLDAEALKVAGAESLNSTGRAGAVMAMREQTNISERRACLFVEISRTILNYEEDRKLKFRVNFHRVRT